MNEVKEEKVVKTIPIKKIYKSVTLMFNQITWVSSLYLKPLKKGYINSDHTST